MRSPEELTTVKDSTLSTPGVLLSDAPCPTKNVEKTFLNDDIQKAAAVLSDDDSTETTSMVQSNVGGNATSPLLIEPPRWAVPAKGEARLEPVCEALGSHPTIYLTRRPCIRVGRSPTNDLQLLHCTSSRRHALVFHHPNGSCYVVDCGSAHGTYINGQRISSTHVCGRVVPHRVRRGALIRFGGPGAPAFVLKDICVGFSSLITDLHMPSSQPTLSPKTHQLGVQLRNRLKALKPVNTVAGSILKKRSFEESSDDEHSRKRARCASPDEEASMNVTIRLVSPDFNTRRRVTFDDTQLVHAISYSESIGES